MTKVNKILGLLAESPKTLKQIQLALGIKPENISGLLAYLRKSNKVTREKIERKVRSNGPKMQWCYKLVDTAEKIE